MEDFILEYINTKDLRAYKGVALLGSYATGRYHKWSDVDLTFLTDGRSDHQIELYNERYFSISHMPVPALHDHLKDVNKLLYGVKTFEKMMILYDPEEILANFKQDCAVFEWSSVLRERAKHLAKVELVSFFEEVQKSIAGIKENHIGKMLNGVYGLNHGMFQVIRLRDQIMTESDNDFYDAVMNHLEDKDPIKELAPMAFGIVKGDLEDQLDAGLEIFMHVSNSLMDFFTDDEKDYLMKLIQEVISVI